MGHPQSSASNATASFLDTTGDGVPDMLAIDTMGDGKKELCSASSLTKLLAAFDLEASGGLVDYKAFSALLTAGKPSASEPAFA